MSHNFYVECQCGETSESYNKGQSDLVNAVRESHVCYLLSQSNWNVSSLERNAGYRGLAAFLGEHFPHGGFKVCGEYQGDEEIPVQPDLPKEVLSSIYTTQLLGELEEISERTQNLKVLLEQ